MLVGVENTLWGRRYHGRCAFCGPVEQETEGGVALLSRHEPQAPAPIRERMEFVSSQDRGVRVRLVENPLEEVAARILVRSGDERIVPSALLATRLLRAWSQRGIHN